MTPEQIRKMAANAQKKAQQKSSDAKAKKEGGSPTSSETLREIVWSKERISIDNLEKITFHSIITSSIYNIDETSFFQIKEYNGRVEKRPNDKFKFLLDSSSENNFYYAEINAGTNKIFNLKNVPYRLPNDSRTFVELIREYPQQNYALLSNKAARFEKDKFLYLNEIQTDLFYKYTDTKNYNPAFPKRHLASVNSLVNTRCLQSKMISTKLSWRLAIGLGIDSIYETGMCFHPVYGVPYLPSSGIKGVVRSFIIHEEFENNEDEAWRDPGFCQIFGSDDKGITKGQQGNVIFFDALPEYGNMKIVADIMNPHYGDYYMNDNVPPADWLNPVPIIFLTLKEAKFNFVVATRKSGSKAIQPLQVNDRDPIVSIWNGKMPLDVVYEFLPRAMKQHGIGAKTAVDYGKLVKV